MSADNIIYVRQLRNGKWAVWDDSASNEDPHPQAHDKRFDTEADALKYAHDLEDEIGYVEYGVCRCGAREEEK